MKTYLARLLEQEVPKGLTYFDALHRIVLAKLAEVPLGGAPVRNPVASVHHQPLTGTGRAPSPGQDRPQTGRAVASTCAAVLSILRVRVRGQSHGSQ